MPEPRTAVKILVEASWSDQAGAVHALPAWMENKSASGACIRIRAPVGVGTKLSLQSRWEQMSGTARYCRSAGTAFLVGVQRDQRNTVPDLAVVAKIASPERKQPEPPESKPNDVAESEASVRNVTSSAAKNQDGEVGASEFQAKLRPLRGEAGKERKSMQRKWSELIHRHSQEDAVTGNVNGRDHGNGKQDTGTARVALPTETVADPPKETVTCFPVRLVRVEDIYRISGLMNPRSGYGIRRVVEMLHSQHTRELSKEARRAAVLMALDVAGVPIEEVLEDARARQAALDSYESEQRKAVEAEWERKAEENVQIQAELERVKEHYMARIARNLEGVARDKAEFNSWLAIKRQESQSISEAVELCAQTAAPAQSSAPLPAVGAAAASPKPV
jgi:hypothetical protein